MLNCIRMFLYGLLKAYMGLYWVIEHTNMFRWQKRLIDKFTAWMSSCKLWKALHFICISIYEHYTFFFRLWNFLKAVPLRWIKQTWKRHHPWPKSITIQDMLYASSWYPCCLHMRNWRCPGDRVSLRPNMVTWGLVLTRRRYKWWKVRKLSSQKYM